MSEDVDYEPDVLKFKQVWGDNKNPDRTAVDPKNLQTIQSNAKNTKKKVSVQGKRQNQPQQKQQPKTSAKKVVSSVTKPAKKQSTQGHKAPVRNPRPNYDEVIEVSTQPNKFFTSSLNNEKNNIAQSHLYLDKGDRGASDGALLMGVSSAYDFKKMLEEKDYELSMLRVANSRTQDRVRYLEKELEKKNQIISQLRERERKMIEKNCSLQSKQFNFDLGKAEYENFRNDSRRLLKMLQATSQYQDFAKFALDDDGVRFLHHVNKDKKTKIDNPPKNSLQTIHFCTCNKAFIPQSGFWVPQKVYSFGKQFVKDRNGQLTEPELQLMLYQLNRIWREREKRIVNTYSAMKAHEVGKYKRKLQSLSKQNRTKSLKQAEENPNNEE